MWMRIVIVNREKSLRLKEVELKELRTTADNKDKTDKVGVRPRVQP